MSGSKWYPWNWQWGWSTIGESKGPQSGVVGVKITDQQKNVTFDSAMQLSSWWAGIEKWSNVVASLPIKIQEYDGEMWQDNTSLDLHELFSGKVNRYQTKTEFFLTLMVNLKSYNNAYVVVDKSPRGRIISLIPLPTSQVEKKILDDGSCAYLYSINGEIKAYGEDAIWHIRGMGNTVIGLSTMSFASNAVSIGIHGEERASKTFKNAGKLSGILKFHGSLTDKQRNELKESFKELEQGDSLVVLEGEMDYTQTQLTAHDMQLLESRRFQIEDIGRFLDIPSVLINDTANSTVWGSGISEVINGWYKLSLRPLVLMIAESMKVHLVEPGKRSKTRILFNFDDLLKLSRKERSEAQAKEIGSAIITPNEAREENNSQPHPQGNELMINTAIQKIETVTGQTDETEITTD